MNLSDYIKVYDNALAPELCQQIIDRFESEPQHQLVLNQGIQNFTEINVIQAKWDFLDPLYASIMYYRQQFWKDCHLTERHVNPEHTWEELRMKRYRAGTDEQIAPHVDAWDLNSCKRFVAYFWYLNDVTEGGETEFYDIDKPLKIAPRAGRLLMFTTTLHFLHAGLTPISNDKYIIGGYFHHGE